MRIYIIDDDSMEREIWKDWLAKESDCQYMICADFRELRLALELVEPDICVVDLEMPYMPGTDVVRYLKHAHPGIKVIVCSGYELPEYQQLAESLGAGFIPKSLDFESRLEVLRGLCGK